MDTPYLKSYYRRGSTFPSSKQIETIRTLKGKVPKYRIIRDFHINENRVNDIWESHERQQQIIQNTISSEILPISDTKYPASQTILPEHLESTTSPNTEIKKRSSKSRSKFVRISDPISSDNVDSTEKISGGDTCEARTLTCLNNIPNTDIVAQIEREIKRKDKNIANSARIMSTT
nr:7876_t:CDS:1 [Entrophospora candida]